MIGEGKREGACSVTAAASREFLYGEGGLLPHHQAVYIEDGGGLFSRAESEERQ